MSPIHVWIGDIVLLLSVQQSHSQSMRDIDDLFAALARSKFRCRFSLGNKERAYLAEKTLPVILDHARKFLNDRLASAAPLHDGRQTPMRGHPVFIAQHATAACCRGCLEKWHHIPRGRPLSEEEIAYLMEIIKRWLNHQTDQ
jgi:hypothetical protein